MKHFHTRLTNSWKTGPRQFFYIATWVSLGAIIYHLVIAPLMAERSFAEEFTYRLVHRVYELPVAALLVALLTSIAWAAITRHKNN